MIKNITKNTIIAEKELTARSFFRRATGLIFKKFDKNMDAMIFEKCSSLHTCFIFFKFDIFFVDKSKKVITLYKDASPWRIFSAKCSFSDCIAIECPAGTIQKSRSAVGDVLEWKQ